MNEKPFIIKTYPEPKEKRKICIPEAQYRQGYRDRDRLLELKKLFKELTKKMNKILEQLK